MKVGIIGFGSIGRRHAKNLQDLGHNVSMWDPAVNSEDIEAGSRGSLISNSDAIVIATPTSQHCNDIFDCRGKPVFVEKPIGASIDDLTALTLLPDIDNIFVGYNLRFNPCVLEAKHWIDGGSIGDPLYASFVCGQYNDKPLYHRSGVILNWSHEIDLSLHLLGRAEVAGSFTRLTNKRDDMTDILLAHDHGAQSHIHLDYLTKAWVRSFYVQGTHGRMDFDLERRCGNLDGRSSDLSFSPKTSELSVDSDYISEMQAFIDFVEGRGRIGCFGKDALETLKICIKVRKAAGLNT